MQHVIVYTDGACDPNPGVGGWAAILTVDGDPTSTREIVGGSRASTNNRMEMTACIEALRQIAEPARVTLHTDSEYVRNAFTKGWLDNWQRRGWKTADKKPVKNPDLWLLLLEQSKRHQIEWRWVRGHADDPLNNRCDELAVEARIKVARGELEGGAG